MDQKIKQAFAYEWLKEPKEPFKAAMKLTKGNSSAAIQLTDALVHDDEVAAFKKELIEQYGEAHFLPSKFEMVRDCIDRGKAAICDDSFQKIYKLAADMMGFVEKPGVTINNNMTSNKVMLIPAPQLNGNGSINQDDWQQRAIEQQQKITVDGEVA